MQRLDSSAEVLEFLRGPARPDSDEPGLDVLLADQDGAALALVVVIDEVPADPPQTERVRLLGPFLRDLARHDIAGAALVVRRGGPAHPGGGDLAWHDAFVGGCSVAGLSCHGVYLATPSGAVPVRPGPRRDAHSDAA